MVLKELLVSIVVPDALSEAEAQAFARQVEHQRWPAALRLFARSHLRRNAWDLFQRGGNVEVEE